MAYRLSVGRTPENVTASSGLKVHPPACLTFAHDSVVEFCFLRYSVYGDIRQLRDTLNLRLLGGDLFSSADGILVTHGQRGNSEFT